MPAIRAARRVLGEKDPNSQTEHGAPPSQAQLDDILRNLKTQLRQRLDDLESQLTSAKNEQHQVYMTGMMKLTKSMKNMKVAEFNALYKCDLLQLVQPTRSNGPQKMRDHQLEHETPAPARRSNRNIETPSRTVRRGEML